MERNSIFFDGFILAPVLDFSIFAGASSFAGDKDIDEFILKDAQRHFEQHMATTYSLRLPDVTNDILAFATLQNDAIKLAEPLDDFPYKSFPAVKIGRLGVNKNFQNKGIGSMLLSIIARLMLTNNRTGCRFITLDAYNTERTLNFYSKNGFMFLKPGKINSERRTIPMYKDLLSY